MSIKLSTVDVQCPFCCGKFEHIESKLKFKHTDKRPTKNLDSLIKAINMSGANVSMMQCLNNIGWSVWIHDTKLVTSVIAYYSSTEQESMYQALKGAVKLVQDRVISLCGYRPITM